MAEQNEPRPEMNSAGGSAIRTYLQGKGYSVLGDTWYGKITEYMQWYKNNVPTVHRYRVWTGTTFVSRDRFRLGMAKICCEDHVNLMLNEKLTIVADGYDGLDKILEKNSFRDNLSRLTEVAFALGSGALVEYKGINHPVIDFVRGDMIFPLTWDGREVTECAFASSKQSGGKLYFYIQIHRIGENGNYFIDNAYVNENGGALEVDADGNTKLGKSKVQASIDTGSKEPLFQLIRPAIVNNIDLDCPLGVSIFGNAVSQLRALDTIYDSYVNEYELGRKRLMVPQSLATIKMAKDGTTEALFDPNDTSFYIYQDDSDKPAEIHEVNLEIRAEAHDLGLQKSLDMFSKKVGLGTGYYKFDGGVVRTATEVISTESDLYRNRKKNISMLATALTEMARRIRFLDTGADVPDMGVSIDFDDSILEDTNTIINENVMLVGAGLRSKKRAIMEIEHCTEEEADKILAEMQAEAPVFDMGGGMDEGGEPTAEDEITPTEAVDAAEEAVGKGLNGAQTQSLIDVIKQFQAGVVTEGQAVNLIARSIGITKEEAGQLLRGDL